MSRCQRPGCAARNGDDAPQDHLATREIGRLDALPRRAVPALGKGDVTRITRGALQQAYHVHLIAGPLAYCHLPKKPSLDLGMPTRPAVA